VLSCHVRKRLGSFSLQVDLEVQDHVVALFGPSGSGKSLTLQAIAGLIRPDAGWITIAGRTAFDASTGVNLPPQERRVGFVFQNYALFPHMTVAENVAYGLFRVDADERAMLVADALRSVRLDGLEQRRPGQLSGGQQQRVALARALVTRPDVLLLDEPFAALDQIIRGEVHQQLLDLLRELPIPTLLVTHHLEEAFALSREIAVLEAGRVLQFGPRDEVYYRPATPSVARHVGMKNLLPGTLRGLDGPYLEIDASGFALRAPAAQFGSLTGVSPEPGQPVLWGFRPEHAALTPHADAAERPGQLVLTGRLEGEVPYGREVTLTFRPNPPSDCRLLVSLPTHEYRRMAAGGPDRWSLSLQAEFVRVFPDQGVRQ
jgi:molybdate transport system ATP-binding protein